MQLNNALNNIISNIYFRIIRDAFFYKKYILLITIVFEFIFPLNFSFASERHYLDYTTSHIIEAHPIANIFDDQYQKTIPKKIKTFNDENSFATPVFNNIFQMKDIDFLPYQLLPKVVDENSEFMNTRKQVVLANHLFTTGLLLNNNNNFPADVIFDTARSALVDVIGKPIQDWLHQFGTTNLQLNLDKNFSLRNSTLDILIPFFDNKKTVLFTQWGVRNQDSRNTFNIGTGIRSYYADWMYGINAFADNDVTRKHRRVSVGAETWTDYLKFSANYYIGTSPWYRMSKGRDSERSANGYDIRAEGWLPAYPKFGGRIMTEKYFGNNVMLPKAFNIQNNPQVLTIGLNYTPIPLVTLNADYHIGKGGKTQGSIGLQLTYHLGDSWESHINPFTTIMTTPRTLLSNRYDLVERNSYLVIKRQKKDVIQLFLPDTLSGMGGETIRLHANIISKHKLLHTKWKCFSLIAAGGNLNIISPDIVAITLPPYKDEPSASNDYPVNAISYDLEHNISNKAYITIQVRQGPIKKNTVSSDMGSTNKNDVEINENELLTVIKDNARADGVTQNLIKIKVKDIHDDPIPDCKITLLASKNVIIPNSSTIKTDKNGIVEVPLFSLKSGVAHVVVTAGKISKDVEINFVAGPVSREKSYITIGSTRLLADGISTSKVQLTLKDMYDNFITGQSDNLEAFVSPYKNFNYSPKISKMEEVNPGSGVYIGTLTAGIGSGRFRVIPKLNKIVLNFPDRVIVEPRFKISAPTTANRHIYVANGIETADVFVKITNVYDCPVEKKDVIWRTSQGHIYVSQTDKNGIAKYSVSTLRASENFIITAAVDHQSPVESLGIRFKADTTFSRRSNVNVYKDYVKANGKELNIFMGNTLRRSL